EPREYFVQRHLRNDAGQPPRVGEDERQAENVVRDGGEQPGDRADDDPAPQRPVAAAAVPDAERVEDDRRRDENPERERAHRAQAVHLGEQAPDAGGGEEEDERPPPAGPVPRARMFDGAPLGHKRNPSLVALKYTNAVIP